MDFLGGGFEGFEVGRGYLKGGERERDFRWGLSRVVDERR